jgi:hypothetical protein
VIATSRGDDVRITFAGGSGSGIDLDPPTTKEENARFFKGIICQVGLEHPVVPFNETRTVRLFLDHRVDLVGLLHSVPFPFRLSRIEVNAPK